MGTPGFRISLASAVMALAAFLGLPARAVPQAAPAAAEHGRFHHVHLNVADPSRTSAFYEKTFGVVPVAYAGHVPALMAERTFILLDKKPGPIVAPLQTGVIHIGWGGVDG